MLAVNPDFIETSLVWRGFVMAGSGKFKLLIHPLKNKSSFEMVLIEASESEARIEVRIWDA
jgi:hypothetical protein